jgi:predicted nucleic acid-binding protein
VKPGTLRLYFDNNVYNRPSDDRSILRNRIEARAVEELLAKVESGDLYLVSSFVVEAEHSRLGETTRRERVGDRIALAQEYVGTDPWIMARAQGLREEGFGEGDALHLAAAEHAGVDYFVTCDDRLLRRARRIGFPVRVVSPPELLEEVTP